MVGTGMGAERGILIKNAEVLERTKSLGAVILDKTGTLTEGRPQVTDIVITGAFERPELLRLLAAAESGSEHPLSRAMVDLAVDEGIEVPGTTEFEAITARGVRAIVEGREVLAGNHRLFEEREMAIPETVSEQALALESEGRTVILVSVDGGIEGIVGIADEVKQNAPRAVAALQRLA